jgi:hypothetical protein
MKSAFLPLRNQSWYNETFRAGRGEGKTLPHIKYRKKSGQGKIVIRKNVRPITYNIHMPVYNEERFT